MQETLGFSKIMPIPKVLPIIFVIFTVLSLGSFGLGLTFGSIGFILEVYLLYAWGKRLEVSKSNLNILANYLAENKGFSELKEDINIFLSNKVKFGLLWTYLIVEIVTVIYIILVLLNAASGFMNRLYSEETINAMLNGMGIGALILFIISLILLLFYLNNLFKIASFLEEFQKKIASKIDVEISYAIKQRNVWKLLLFTIITLGIYFLYFVIVFTNEINKHLYNDNDLIVSAGID